MAKISEADLIDNKALKETGLDRVNSMDSAMASELTNNPMQQSQGNTLGSNISNDAYTQLGGGMTPEQYEIYQSTQQTTEPLGKQPDKVQTALGEMNRPPSIKEITSPENARQLADAGTWALGGGIEDISKSALGKLQYGEIGKALSRKASDAVQPAKTAEALRAELAGGEGKTAQDITKEVQQRIQYAGKSREAEALQHLENVKTSTKSEDIFNVPMSNLPEGNLGKVANEFGVDPADVTTDKIKLFQKALKDYRKNNDLDEFVSKGEDIFGTEVTDKQLSNIGNMLSLPTETGSKYLKVEDEVLPHLTGDAKDLGEAYKKDRTFSNAHYYQAQLGSSERKLEKLAADKKLDPAGYNELKAIKKAKQAVIDDINSYLDRKGKELNTDLKGEYKTFKNKFAKFANTYRVNPTTRKIVQEGTDKAITGTQLLGIFKNSPKYGLEIAKDIGQEGVNQLLATELMRSAPGDAEKMAELIEEAYRTKGLQDYMSPKLLETAKTIQKQLRNKSYLKTALATAGGAVGGSAFGIPYVGAGVGALISKSPDIAKALAKIRGK